MVRELLEESLSLDGRLFRTVSALSRPGRLTRLYLDGKRAPFLTPLRLYLLGSLVLFSTMLSLTTPDASEVNLSVAGQLVTGPEIKGGTTIRIMEDDTVLMRWANTRWADKMADLRTRPPQELLDRLFGGLRSVLPLALILFVPFLAIVLKVLYLRRRAPDGAPATGRSGPLYVDHLIFGVHFQSALFFALGATWLALRAAAPGFFWSLVCYIAVLLLMLTVYLPRALGRVYGGGGWMTAARTGVLVLAYFFLLGQAVGPSVLLVLWRL